MCPAMLRTDDGEIGQVFNNFSIYLKLPRITVLNTLHSDMHV